MEAVRGTIFDISEFTVHDGPGIRATVFFKGCRLDCIWCHNPEGKSFFKELSRQTVLCENCGLCERPCGHDDCRAFDRCLHICPKGLIKICGEELTADELAERLRGYGDMIKSGGVTFSGGEPLAQPEFLYETIRLIKPIHTAVETSGYGDGEWFKKIAHIADLIIFDIKTTDAEIHRRYTGGDNSVIINNLKILIDTGKPFWARITTIPGVNDNPENYARTAKLLKRAKGRVKVELVSYNPLANAKYAAFGKEERFIPVDGQTAYDGADIFISEGFDCEVL